MPIRYMGTKRHIAHHVNRIVSELAPVGRVLDLFSGIGCVAESLANVAPVATNDALEFTAAFARARFTAQMRHMSAGAIITMLRRPYRDAAEQALKRNRPRLRDEQRAVDLGPVALTEYMARAEHVANSDRVARTAKFASTRTDDARYCLTATYFSAGYFSLRQAIHIDALRLAIDRANLHPEDRDWVMAAWLAAAAKVANAPGHTAQFLKPNNDGVYQRIRRSWSRNIWETFQDRLIAIKPVGTRAWRVQNQVAVGDALRLLHEKRVVGVGAVYADPPYTKDQYSRYYHVYETLYRYDFPSSSGAGRVPSSRFTSTFSLKTGIVEAFTDLMTSVSEMNLPLILSYPSDSLLSKIGSSIPEIADGLARIASTESFDAEHSTLGASNGSKHKNATENLYVILPG